MTIEQLLIEMVKIGASDLHVKAGHRPRLRVDGSIIMPFENVLTHEAISEGLQSIMNDSQYYTLHSRLDVDFSYEIENVGRYRINAFHNRGTAAFVARHVKFKIPTLEELDLPIVLKELAARPRGLILVTGTTGSGKSSTLAAMLGEINANFNKTIVTIEDPVEYLHKDIKSYIYQRNVGDDSVDYKSALHASLRQDPDVILIGEIRDQETMSIALEAADTGHLVFATLHTTNATDTLERILGMFAPEFHYPVRSLIATVLVGIVSQRLLPREGGGRIPATEVLINTPHIKDCILHPDKKVKLQQAISEGSAQYKTQTFDQSIYELYKQRLITYDTAVYHATNPTDFDLKVNGISGESDRTWNK